MFFITVGVFAFPGNTDGRSALRALLERAGYQPHSIERGSPGGFQSTAPNDGARYCKGSNLVDIGMIDSMHAPGVYAVMLMGGEAGRQNCSASSARAGGPPVTIPTLTPPSGALNLGGGSSGGGDQGTATTTVRTTMPVDSVLAHYSSQLVAAGRQAAPRSAGGDGVGVRRFSFHEAQNAWSAVLLVVANKDRRDVSLHFFRSE